MKEIKVKSSIDGSPEPSLFYMPSANRKIPLLVGLHTWSADRKNQENKMLPYAKKNKWALLLPEFRGPNLTSNPRCREACGSLLAKQDIIDAIEFVFDKYGERKIDKNNIFLLGGSGGGHMGLLMAAFKPNLWRTVNIWCPITDLIKWHSQNLSYKEHIEKCCGGKPDKENKNLVKEYKYRSPINYIDKLADVEIYINHGKWDISVPYSHSYELYRRLIKKYSKARIYLNIFNGGHEIHYEEAFKIFNHSKSKHNYKLTK